MMPRTSGLRLSSKANLLFAVIVAFSVMASLLALRFRSSSETVDSAFQLLNFVGPTTQSLLSGGGLTACSEDMGTLNNPICFHGGRMPLATWVVAFGVKLLGDHVTRINIMKLLLLLVPLQISAWLALLYLPNSRWRSTLTLLLLVAPFGMTIFLADVVEMQVEEGYSYSLLALATAILFFAMRRSSHGLDDKPHLSRALLFVLTVDGLYLAKSSMVLAVAILTVSYLLHARCRLEKLLVLALVAAAPLGWAVYQHHASGRYSFGTSIDGINLHKSNNPMFLSRYIPPPGLSLDGYDWELNRGQSFPNEWSFNDYHQHQALAYIRSHPRETLIADGRKLWVIFFTLNKVGWKAPQGVLLKVETFGFLIFRLMLWAAILSSCFSLINVSGSKDLQSRRAAGLTFLLLVGAAMLPYVVGFAFTRHISVLIYPAALLCCRMLEEPIRDGTQPARQQSLNPVN